ncbi:MAG: rRNA pseudouridine synthase [Propionibacteriaceae bacterium]|jgi:23S rRNA pseudouridine2605 synthase|nr:rRNA pseudouridine synthase [Propionibacteriaceae bacterium]
MTEGIRLQKALAQAGIASRRASEILIDEGRVQVNGEVVNTQGVRVDPAIDIIRVDDRRIPPVRDQLYLMLNKPAGVLSSMDDPHGRPALDGYLGRWTKAGLFHVGRLDAETQGLLLLTNDGDFAQRIAHPSYAVAKTYLAEVQGNVDTGTLAKLRRGVELDDGPIQADSTKVVSRAKGRTLLEVVLHSGRNRVVRRMLEAVGHPVRRLVRIKLGSLRLGGLKPGELRELTASELAELFDVVGM